MQEGPRRARQFELVPRPNTGHNRSQNTDGGRATGQQNSTYSPMDSKTRNEEDR